MSFKIFLRDMNSVSNARNVLYTLGSSSPRVSTELVPNPFMRQLDTVEKSKSDSVVVTNFDFAYSLKSSKKVKSMLSQKYHQSEPKESKESQEKNMKEVEGAGNRIFIAAMLYSWRKQRHLIKELSQQLESLQRRAMKNEHRAHVYEKLYDNERERNYELRKKFRESQDGLTTTKEKHDSLTSSYVALKTSVSLLEQQLLVREEQYEGLQVSFSEMQTTLFRSMAKERELQRQLTDEQRRVQSHMMREKDLKEKLKESKKCAEFKEQNLCDQLNLKQSALMRYKQDNESLCSTMKALLAKKEENEFLDSRIENTINEIIQVKNEVQSLRDQLQNSWDNRLKCFWRRTSGIRYRLAETILIIAYCVLPSFPLPRNSTVTFSPLRLRYF